jgi:hypothetical protein
LPGGQTINWVATASGGNKTYTYQWINGANNTLPTGISSSTTSNTYTTSMNYYGAYNSKTTYSATVKVTSNGVSVTCDTCSGTVTIGKPPTDPICNPDYEKGTTSLVNNAGLCLVGTVVGFNSNPLTTSAGPWSWYCSYGYSIWCGAPLNGTCNPATNGQITATAPSGLANLCNTTYPINTTPSFITTYPWSWTCAGSPIIYNRTGDKPIPAGTSASCSDYLQGSCGSANGYGTITKPPTAGKTLCAATSTTPIVSGDGKTQEWSWTCAGTGPTVNVKCEAPLNGSCGSAVRTYAYSETFPGSYSYCATGAPPNLPPSTPVAGGSSTWSCNYVYTGTGLISNAINAYPCTASMLPPGPPSVSSMKVNPSCGPASGVGFENFIWNYVAGSIPKQGGFDFQVSSTGFASNEVSRSINNSSNSATVFVNINHTTGLDDLVYNKSYQWRVRVYDSQNNYSKWYYYGTTTTSPGNYMTTPLHPYPFPAFTASHKSATLISGNAPVAFTDTSTCYYYDATSKTSQSQLCSTITGTNATYYWDYKDGATCNSSTSPSCKGNQTHVYHTASTYNVLLEIKDDAGDCTAKTTVEIINPSNVPQWKEISPFQ